MPSTLVPMHQSSIQDAIHGAALMLVSTLTPTTERHWEVSAMLDAPPAPLPSREHAVPFSLSATRPHQENPHSTIGGNCVHLAVIMRLSRITKLRKSKYFSSNWRQLLVNCWAGLQAQGPSSPALGLPSLAWPNTGLEWAQGLGLTKLKPKPARQAPASLSLTGGVTA
jgi:hypothetical protein